MLIDFEVTIDEKDFAKLKKLSEEFQMSFSDTAIICMRESVERYLEKVQKEKEASEDDTKEEETVDSKKTSNPTDDSKSSD